MTDSAENERIRIQGIALVVALILGAGDMTASAHPDDGNTSAPSTIGPVDPASAFHAVRTERALKLSPSDTASALRITLPVEPAPQHSSQPSDPLLVAFHRDMPKEYQDDLTPKLGWISIGDKAAASQMTVTSPGATNMRMALVVDLPPGGEIRFFGTDQQQHYPMLTREDIEWKGATPLLRWSPVVEGDTIGAEVVLPSKEAPSSFSFAIDTISHGFGKGGGFGYPPTLQCSNHIDVECARGRFAENQNHAVGRIRWENPVARRGGACSGTLLNDRDANSFVPYFLTARHCIRDQGDASSITTRWFYQRAACGGNTLRAGVTTNYGADLLQTRSEEDSTFLRYKRLLPTRLPSGMWFVYSGWDRSLLSARAVYGLHHPGGGVMKYSRGNIVGGPSRRWRVEGTDIVVEWGMAVAWSEGTIEPGSSGSGLFLSDTGHLVGVASVALGDGCHAHAGYGFFNSFFLGENSNDMLDRWLDATSAPVVPPPYPDDHGNQRSTATVVSTPSTSGGEVHYGGDVDYFRVHVRSAGQLRAYTTGGIDTYGTLFRESTRIAQNDDGGSGTNFSIMADVQPGTYYIEVRGHSIDHQGPYSLTVELVHPDDHGNAPDTATLVSIPSTTEGNLGYAGDVDYFRIDVGAAARIVVSTTGTTDTYGTLFRGEARVTENDDGGSGTNFSITADVQAGTYYIAVRGFGAYTTGAYSLRVDYGAFVHTLPFVTSAGHRTLNSLVRIINNSDRAGRVTIHAIDDTGERFGPATLWHKARQARHFDSRRLEDGTGMIGRVGVGDGEGNWRLEVSSTLDITPLAYVRGARGIETTMHDVVRTVAGRQHVVNFHKAPDNRSTASSYSLLRIVNPNDSAASVTISGRDDLGVAAAGGEVRLSLAAGAARMLNSTRLENGGSGLQGRLGSEGTGRWRLTVSADQPVWVMSLLFSPSAGYLTNLSSERLEP